MTIKPRISIPNPIKAGQIVQIKTLANHVMETGNRRGPDGQMIARNIIHTFTATYNGQDVFKAELGSGISANPFIAFRIRAQPAGQLVLTWADDSGETVVERIDVPVS